MKPDGLIAILAGAVLIAVVTAYAGATSAATRAEAEAIEKFNLGVSAFARQDLRDAVEWFRDSFDLVPDAATAYFLSVSFARMRVIEQAEHFALRALSLRPPLDSRFVRDANKIIAWARRAQAAWEDIPPSMRAKLDFVPPPPPDVDVPGAKRMSAPPTGTASVPSHCEKLIDVPAGANCRDFYADRRTWSSETIRTCGLHQVRRYKAVLHITTDAEWRDFLARCK